MATGQMAFRFALPHFDSPLCSCFDQSEKRLIGSAYDGMAFITNYNTGAVFGKVYPVAHPISDVQGLTHAINQPNLRLIFTFGNLQNTAGYLQLAFPSTSQSSYSSLNENSSNPNPIAHFLFAIANV
ncbi:uncharacterized protein MONOS_12186 [Monocercomonoides exilis]|uniref:uncharacterized protein n=1 Tax=Monocercomonoides exilis TaxID=2049356 RepID=UPI00355A88A5|nr:hypothetical protein MONOS_12186 [Monocercomonoides exilis]|eukprot:MONOS_12186.1-p1 / transcript=MONOS_12186.1 / gene=MONOS_12186 / organism=Monocercomonoides_exilis_PA203 / gene_product=unspecified product / transcript_product=unspecified product / location=Mono_scaffold00657:22010-22390(-) / protein_length=127 / sequence_SO=supercontig / SO=protein_coding / is_pseudo=false